MKFDLEEFEKIRKNAIELAADVSEKTSRIEYTLPMILALIEKDLAAIVRILAEEKESMARLDKAESEEV